ncbi:MAG: putative glycolipid-binding domain-containing protein [Gemmatimonadota bacterium]
MGIEPQTILWRRMDRPGHEAAVLLFRDPAWSLRGSVIVLDHGVPCRLDYAVVCDAAWHTLWARVNGWMGTDPVNHRISRSPAGRWRHNGIEQPHLDQCIDMDLGFSPSTNLLPIRRLGLGVGDSAPVAAAWLKFPEFSLTRLDQVYHREADRQYRYESGAGRFTATLEVDGAGMVLRYGDIWKVEPTT